MPSLRLTSLLPLRMPSDGSPLLVGSKPAGLLPHVLGGCDVPVLLPLSTLLLAGPGAGWETPALRDEGHRQAAVRHAHTGTVMVRDARSAAAPAAGKDLPPSSGLPVQIPGASCSAAAFTPTGTSAVASAGRRTAQSNSGLLRSCSLCNARNATGPSWLAIRSELSRKRQEESISQVALTKIRICLSRRRAPGILVERIVVPVQQQEGRTLVAAATGPA